jgi:NAD-dependent DNA ligase
MASRPVPLAASKILGKTFAFCGRFAAWNWDRHKAAERLQELGGRIADDVTDAVDHLVVRETSGKGPRNAWRGLSAVERHPLSAIRRVVPRATVSCVSGLVL